MIETMYKAALAARLADDKKGADLLVLDVRDQCNFADVFVICTGNNRLHLKSIAENIVDGLRKLGVSKPLDEGMRNSTWTVVDFGDVVVHLMSPEARDYYRLEALWGDAEVIDWERVLTEHPVDIAVGG